MNVCADKEKYDSQSDFYTDFELNQIREAPDDQGL